MLLVQGQAYRQQYAFNSIYLLDPNTVYFFKATWGRGEVRLLVREGGVNGRNIYEVAVPARLGTYNPTPFYAYLGTPPGRSGYVLERSCLG